MVQEIEIRGAEHLTPDAIRDHLVLEETSWLPWEDDVEYIDGVGQEDAERIVRLYHASGYYDVQVQGPRLEVLDAASRDVRVVYTVREGPPTRVRHVRLDWQGTSPARAAIEAAVTLTAGATFTVAGLNATAAGIRAALHDAGHARAEVRETAAVDREARWADVTVTLTPGPVCRIRALELLGRRTVPGDLVKVEAAFALGATYSPALLQEVEQRVYAMEVFGSVAAEARPVDGAPDQVDLVLHLTEAPPQRLKVGAGVGFEPNRWDGRVSTFYTNANLFGRLTRLDLGAKVGWSVLPNPWAPQEHGPVLEVRPRLRKKGLLERHLVWTADPSFELGLEEGYKFYSPELRLGLSRFLFGLTLAELSYSVAFFDFFDLSPAFGDNRTLLGRDFRDPYLLSYLEAGYTVYLTDRITDPQNGVVLEAVYDVAGIFLGGHFDYHKVTPTLRAYWRPLHWFQLAARARVGMIFGHQGGAAPITKKYYLGGADTVRGWGMRRLSPRIENCDADGSDCSVVPVGGDTMVLGNLELRFVPWGPLWIALFGDVGDVRAGEVEFQPDQWNYSVGGGVRYDSPIGKIRLDFGWRINETERFTGEQQWALHFGLGEMF